MFLESRKNHRKFKTKNLNSNLVMSQRVQKRRRKEEEATETTYDCDFKEAKSLLLSTDEDDEEAGVYYDGGLFVFFTHLI